MTETGKVALLGGGVIGSGWAARLLINGFNVAVCDPSPDAEGRARAVVEDALRAYRALTLAPVDLRGELSFTADLAEAVGGAVFVQESAPESAELKRRLLADASRLAGEDVVIASSTSGLLPSELQADCERPQRVCVGHPFNPVYLMPLVEVVGGALTSEDTRRRAAAFYGRIGMHPLVVRKEVDAFIADRLMESVWREALHLVNDGVATVDEIDQAMCHGPGLRWAFMGVFMVYRLGGGEGGMRHFLEQFGPTLRLPWARFDGPELDAGLAGKIAEQSDRQSGGRSIRELARLRDDCLVSVLQGLRTHDWAAGSVCRRYEERLYEASHRDVMGGDDDLSRPLRLHEDRVRPEWVDYNNHMTESRYLQVFGDSTDALLRYVGIDADYHGRGLSYYTAETHICHLAEISGGKPLCATTQILGVDGKRIHLFHTILGGEDGAPLATAEMVLLHVDTRAGRTCPADPAVLGRLGRIADAHAGLERPAQAGRSVSIARKSAKGGAGV